MKNIWKLFVGDVRRLTSNIVSIIIVIGLVVIPGLFSWFNVSASWDPFANTGNLKFAVANDDEGYKSDLIPVKISIGDQVVNTLRANDQMDWTFTTKKEAIDGTKSGKYYAAVVIPKDFSTRMMTFFTADGDHATLTYYNNEKKNALAPKITGQGADTVAAQINEMFSATLTSTALNIASQLADELDKPKSQATLTNFSNNMNIPGVPAIYGSTELPESPRSLREDRPRHIPKLVYCFQAPSVSASAGLLPKPEC